MTSVLGLVRRDLLMDMAETVAREDGAGLFELAAAAAESGYDMRLVIRELARLTRDLLIIGVDAGRAERSGACRGRPSASGLKALAASFSAEDLMRAFDVLTKAEYDIRGSVHPRYHLEMALLRWIHLRKLVPLSDLIQGLEKGAQALGPERCGQPSSSSRTQPQPWCRRTPQPSAPSKPSARKPPDPAAATVKAAPAPTANIADRRPLRHRLPTCSRSAPPR